MKKLNTERGFTLIEILTVIAIIGVVFLVFIPQVNSAFLKSKESGIYTDFRIFQQANESYFRETRGMNLQLSSLNKYLDKEHKVSNNGTINQTNSKDPWKNPYEVELQSGKITFSSYGKNENPALKPYNVVTYLYNGTISSCTTGLGVKNIQLSILGLDANFKCGDDIQTSTPPPIGTLSAPTVFVATNVTQTKVELSWNVVSEATAYILKKDGVTIYTGNNTSFSDITLTADTTYAYSVAAKNGSNLSPYATLTVKTTSPLPSPLSTPTNFVANNITETSVDLSWDSVTGATSYELKRNEGVVYTGSNRTYKDTPLTKGTIYTYTLVAKNGSTSSGVTTKSVTTKLSDSNPSTPVNNFSIGYQSSLVIKSDGTLWGWGANYYGIIGSSYEYVTPTKIGTAKNWKEVFVDGGTAYGIKTDGTLWTWGSNFSGNLGHGDNMNRNTPTKVGTDTNWKSISVGSSAVAALKMDGSLWTWGRGDDYQLGHGNRLDINVPTKVGTDTNWKEVHIFLGGAYGIKTDGTLWMWGKNENGQLGVGDTVDRAVPTKVGTDTNWKEVLYGRYFRYAIKNDGTFWAWGENEQGQLGLGDTIERRVPTRVGTETDWESIKPTSLFFNAFKKNGTIWGWGFSEYGLVTESATEIPIISQFGSDASWKKVDGSVDFIIALKHDGTLWSVGNNEKGQLGLGDTTARNVPTKIGNDSDWKDVYVNYDYVHAVKNDGTIWVWGNNESAQLGVGDKNNRKIPTKITIP